MRTLLLCVALLVAGPPPTVMAEPARYAVYYSDAAEFQALARYELLVLDGTYHPPLAPLKEEGIRLLGYLSLGEVETGRSHFSQVKDAGLLVRESEAWPGSHLIDVRARLWQRMVIESLVPALLRKGFDGVFLGKLCTGGFRRPPVLRNGARELSHRPLGCSGWGSSVGGRAHRAPISIGRSRWRSA